MALVDPLFTWVAGREQFTNINDSGRLSLDVDRRNSERRRVSVGVRNDDLTTSEDSVTESYFKQSIGEFDPGSGRTLAACLTHASHGGPQGQPANGCVTREQSADFWGIAGPTAG